MADNMLSFTEKIELKQKIERYKNAILGLEEKAEPFDYFKTGCTALTAATNIINEFVPMLTDKEIFEGAQDQVIALYEKKIADIRALKFVPPSNIVNPDFTGGNDA